MKRILFVDDDSMVLDGIRRLLYADRKRWEMKFVMGGEEALRAFACEPFDVIVSDMLMPGMDGAELLRHVQDLYPGTARIILSGHNAQEPALRALGVAHRFLSKPCSAGTLRDVIERSCAMEDLLQSPKLISVVAAIGELPALSDTYVKLRTALTDPVTSMAQVASIIEGDVAMSAKVLQIVNSAFFGLAHRSNSVLHAVNCLGTDTIKNLVLVANAFLIFVPQGRIPNSCWQEFQDHAHKVSAIAGLLPLEKSLRDTAIIAGLLHDIGQLALASRMPNEFHAIGSLAARNNSTICEAEFEILGVTHAEIGAFLLGLWGLPYEIVEAIAHHHQPNRIPHVGLDASLAIYVAELIAEREATYSSGQSIELSAVDEDVLLSLGLSNEFPTWCQLAANASSSRSSTD